MVTLLSPRKAATLEAADFTYSPVGGTAGSPPPGYRYLISTRPIADLDLERAGQRLVAWQIHERAGLRVSASSPVVEPGAVALMRLGIGLPALGIPCRVVYVINEPDRVGFAYGTLPGHPECGEELFLLERDDAGRVTFTVSAFSKPATLLARAGGRLTRWAQDQMTNRYLRAAVQG